MNACDYLEAPADREAEHAAPDPTGSDRLAKAIWAFVWLGVILRVVTYLLNFPLWGDEAFVAVNLIAPRLRRLDATARLWPGLPPLFPLAGIDGRQGVRVLRVVIAAHPNGV